MIRLLMADDHPVVRAGLRALLAAEADFTIAIETGAAEDAVAAAMREPVDVALMDLQFGGAMQGVEATRRLRALPHPPVVLILTNYDTDADILGAIEAGASGYLLKDTPPAEIMAAVRAAAAGGSALAPAVASRLMSRVQAPTRQLTPREADVLTLAAEGKSNKEIGRDLFLSEATVKSHLARVFAKLEVASRTAAVAKARQTGIIRERRG
ncbi:MAG: response regulator transcription factor [Thermomicrobiales bacterium]|nr:response regulator transcription factor [Thermomicrobiales bacterium]